MHKMKTKIKINDRTREAIKSDGTRIPVVDSKFTFLIQPNEEDIKNGIPGDPENCMYCLACRRMFGSELVWVARGVAYVELKGRGGKLQLHRLIPTSPARMEIKGYDILEQVTAEAVIFAKPSGQNTLGGRSEAWRKYQERKNAGTVKHRSAAAKSKTKQQNHELVALGLRDRQTGRFQFKSR
jgi:hypothetical protein